MAALAEGDYASFNQEEALECLSTNLTSVMDRLAPLKVIRPVKGHDAWLDGSLINLRRERDTASSRYLRARENKPNSELTATFEKGYETLRNDFKARFTFAWNAFMQTKMSHALDTKIVYGASCETLVCYLNHVKSCTALNRTL